MKFTPVKGKPLDFAYDKESNTIVYDKLEVWKPCEGSEIIRSELCEKMLSGTPAEAAIAKDAIKALEWSASDDDIFEGLHDVYQGDDGKFYFVEFAQVGGEPVDYYRNGEGVMVPTLLGWRGGVREPICWYEVQRKDGAAK